MKNFLRLHKIQEQAGIIRSELLFFQGDNDLTRLAIIREAAIKIEKLLEKV